MPCSRVFTTHTEEPLEIRELALKNHRVPVLPNIQVAEEGKGGRHFTGGRREDCRR